MARRKSSVHRPTYSGKRLEDVLQMKKTGRKAPAPARKAPVASKRYGRKALYQPDLALEEEGDDSLDSEDEAFETIIAAVNDEGSHDEASNDEGDDDDTDSDEDEDSDSSIDETSLPEAYRRRKFGTKSAKKSMLQNENESAIADSSEEESDLSSLSDIETRLSSKDSTLVRRKSRRGSVVDHTLDEHVEFPRPKKAEGDFQSSDDDSFEEDSLLKAIEADSSPNADESDFDDDIGDLDDEELENDDLDSPISEGNNSYSSIDAFSDEVDKDFDAVLDNDIEREEEDMILQEIAENGDRLQTFSPTDDDESVVSFGNYSRRNSHSQNHYTGYSSDEDDYSFEDNDPFFEPRDPNQVLITNGEIGVDMNSNNHNRNNSHSNNNHNNNNSTTNDTPRGFTSDDDSYLFGYFFSDGSSTDEDKPTVNGTSIKRRPSLSTPKKPPVAGSSSSIFKTQSGYTDYDDSGDSTDEDTTLPPRTQKKCNTATEILSSSNIASRPPMLGSWVMTKERPFGIIDGLTTRSLSGQKSPTNHHDVSSNGIRFSANMESDDCSEISDLNDIVLDEFIYTSDLDEEAPKDASTEDQPYSTSSNVPLSAFRNRGLVANPLYQQRFTGTPIPSRRRSSHSREAVITPVRSMKKIKKKAFRKDLLTHKDYDGNDYDSVVAEYSDGFNGFYGGL